MSVPAEACCHPSRKSTNSLIMNGSDGNPRAHFRSEDLSCLMYNYHSHRPMTDNNPSITKLFGVAALYAIYKWVESEQCSVKQIQSSNPIDVEILSRWLTQWNLNRPNPKNDRKKLVTALNKIRTTLKAEDISGGVMDGVYRLQVDYRKTRQISLMSKFAFSLHPDLAAPYDRRALHSLGRISECSHRKLEQDYSAYLTEFDRLADEWGKELDNTGMTESLRPLWETCMSEIIFKRRTTDKLLWLLGGQVPVDRLALFGGFYFNILKVT